MDFEIYLLDPSTKVVAGPLTMVFSEIENLDWSPDGSEIVFDHYGGGIYLLRLSDGIESTVTDAAGGFDVQPSWSPDGAKIVFRSSRDGRPRLYTIKPSGNDVQTLLRSPGSAPDWQAMTLGLRASADSLIFGRKAVLTVHLYLHGSSLDDTVSVYQISVEGAQALVTRGTVDASGDLSVKVFPRAVTVYFASWHGDADHLPAQSPPVFVAVRAIAKGHLSGSYGKSGRYRLIHDGVDPRYLVDVKPRHPDAPVDVSVDKHRANGWKSVSERGFRLGPRGTATIVIVGTKRASFRVRIFFEADADHLSATSHWSYFKVTN